eukprot:TRINITY_DN12684_c0_g1_i1.p3 TRINITY_DN12684_c0_g1~~TRINITY_DN12684_c0_g1_i1.p3  ORF type:complete len:55 (+),score=8.91 TRINITY_DN12684_c0_g1_i1:273-437(+)
MNEIMPAWDFGLEGARVGARRKLIIHEVCWQNNIEERDHKGNRYISHWRSLIWS